MNVEHKIRQEAEEMFPEGGQVLVYGSQVRFMDGRLDFEGLDGVAGTVVGCRVVQFAGVQLEVDTGGDEFTLVAANRVVSRHEVDE